MCWPGPAAGRAQPGTPPHAEGLVSRQWYGAASRRSVQWAARVGLNLLTGNIVFGEGATDFTAAQLTYIHEYRRLAPAGRADTSER